MYLQLRSRGSGAVELDGGERSAQKGLEAEGQLHRVEAERFQSLHLRAEVLADAAAALHASTRSQAGQIASKDLHILALR